MECRTFLYDDSEEPRLAGEAVQEAREKAWEAGVPVYYIEHGFLVEDLRGKKKRLTPITRNQMFGFRLALNGR